MADTNTNLNLYTTFIKVAKTGSYSKASEVAYKSIPAISKNIKDLEDTLGVQLFYREKDGVVLTKEGQELLDGISNGLNIIELTEKLVTQKNDMNLSEITIGCQSHLMSCYLIDKLVEVKKDYPNIHINIISDVNSVEMLRLLENHKIDFIIDIVPVDMQTHNTIVTEELYTLKNVFISKTPIEITDIKQLEDFKYILNFDSTITTSKLKETLKEYNINLKCDIREDITESRITMVKKGLGISYVMKDAVKDELKNNELYEIKVPFELPEQKLNLVYIKNTLTNAAKQLIKKYLKV